MNNKEAIYRIQDHMRVHRLYEPSEFLINEALRMAMEALQEQEAVEPLPYVLWGQTSEKIMLCGACKDGKIFLNEHYYYCPKCGRKVKWDAAG